MKKLGIDWPPCTKHFDEIKYEDILFTTVARNKCYLCGAFKRKKPCPPFNRSVKFYKEKFASYKKIYLIYLSTDGVTPWREGIEKEKLVKKINRGLKGVAKGMPLELHKKMLELKRRNPAKYDIYISGSCSMCRPCNVNGKCLKGAFAHSPEGSGIDVINTLKKGGYSIENVPYNYVVNVGFVGVKKRKD